MTPWGKWFQDNSDKFLLACLWLFSVFLVVYMVHFEKDAEHISWAREISSGLMGALLGIITGSRLAMSSSHRNTVNIDTDSVVDETKKEIK